MSKETGLQPQLDQHSTLTEFLAAREKVVNVQPYLAEKYRLTQNQIAKTMFASPVTFTRLHQNESIRLGSHPDIAKYMHSEDAKVPRAGAYLHHMGSVAIQQVPKVSPDQLPFNVSSKLSTKDMYTLLLAHENGHGFMPKIKPVTKQEALQLVEIETSEFDKKVHYATLVNVEFFISYLAKKYQQSPERILTLLTSVIGESQNPTIVDVQNILYFDFDHFLDVLEVNTTDYENYVKSQEEAYHFFSIGHSISCNMIIDGKSVRITEINHKAFDTATEAFAETYSLYTLFKIFEQSQEKPFTSFGVAINAFKKSPEFKSIIDPTNLLHLPILEAALEFNGFEALLDVLLTGNEPQPAELRLHRKKMEALEKIAEAQFIFQNIKVVLDEYFTNPAIKEKLDEKIYELEMGEKATLMKLLYANNPERYRQSIELSVTEYQLRDICEFTLKLLTVCLDIVKDQENQQKNPHKKTTGKQNLLTLFSNEIDAIVAKGLKENVKTAIAILKKMVSASRK